MYLVVFRSRKSPDHDAAAYARDAQRMVEMAKAQAGFLAVKTYTAEDGETVTVSEWESKAAAKAWRAHGEHAPVQGKGRQSYYESYTMFTCADPDIARFETNEDS